MARAGVASSLCWMVLGCSGPAPTPCNLLSGQAFVTPVVATIPVNGVLHVAIAVDLASVDKYTGIGFFIEGAPFGCTIGVSSLTPEPTTVPDFCAKFGALYARTSSLVGGPPSTTAVYVAPAMPGVFHIRVQYEPSPLSPNSRSCEGRVTVTVQ